jgi:hypothetical protein
MERIKGHTEEEMEELRKEIENFKKEKERVRSIVGQIGGMPTFNTKIFNIIFSFFVLICLVVSLTSKGILSLAMVELAIATVSFKLIYLIHSQNRAYHFQLWILSSVEWRLNEIIKLIGGNKK